MLKKISVMGTMSFPWILIDPYDTLWIFNIFIYLLILMKKAVIKIYFMTSFYIFARKVMLLYKWIILFKPKRTTESSNRNSGAVRNANIHSSTRTGGWNWKCSCQSTFACFGKVSCYLKTVLTLCFVTNEMVIVKEKVNNHVNTMCCLMFC